MSSRLDLTQIRAFWAKQAADHGLSPSASWSDRSVIEKEILEISGRLSDGDSVLDIGCANGFSTLRLASEKRVDIRGLDYVEEMIEHAERRSRELLVPLAGTVSFGVGDITALEAKDESFDKVVVIRVVINLGSWERQLRGLKEATRVLKRGGLLLLSEATLQGFTRLNQFRQEWNLSEIPMPPFNLYLDQDQVVEALAPSLSLKELVDFSSTYYVGTRILKPLLIEALGSELDVANPDMEWNRFWSALPAWGDYGVQRLFVFEKR